MHQKIAIVGQNPLTLFVALDAVRPFAALPSWVSISSVMVWFWRAFEPREQITK